MYVPSVTDAIITAVTAATAVTGGVVTGDNQAVVTGDSSASVHVTNVINAGDQGGSSYTEIIKTVDGGTSKEVRQETFAPGEPVIVETAVEASTGGQSAGASEGQTAQDSDSVQVQEEMSTSTEPVSVVGRVGTVLEKIVSLWSSVLSYFTR